MSEDEDRPSARQRLRRQADLEQRGVHSELARLISAAETPWLDEHGRPVMWQRLSEARDAGLQRVYDVPLANQADVETLVRGLIGEYAMICEEYGHNRTARRFRLLLDPTALDDAVLGQVRPTIEQRVVSGWCAPRGDDLRRAVRRARLRDGGAPVQHAAAEAYLRFPRIDGVTIPHAFDEALSSLLQKTLGDHPAGEATLGEEALGNGLAALRDLALEHDVPEYAVAGSRLLDLVDGTGARHHFGGGGKGDEPLVGDPAPDNPLPDATETHPDDPEGWRSGSGAARHEGALSAAAAVIQRLAARAVVLGAARSLGDVLGGDLDRLVQGDPELADAISILDARDIAGRALDDLSIGTAFTEALEDLDPRQRWIAEHRTLAPEPATLDVAGRHLGLSRESARQLEKGLLAQLRSRIGDPLRVSLDALHSRIGEVTEREAFRGALSDLVSGVSSEIRPMAEELLRHELSDVRTVGDYVVSPRALEAVKRLRARAEELADEHGIVGDLEPLVAGEDALADVDGPTLLNLVGVDELFGSVVLRRSVRNATLLALKALGRPSTKEEVAERAGVESARSVANQLSALNGVVKVDLRRWGLAEWTDDPYEGVANEIVQRIEEDGGSTLKSRLLQEIPDRFGVARSTVEAYIGTDRFETEDGYVRLSRASDIELRDLSTLSCIVWRPDGAPVYRFDVDARYLDGYSIKVPKEVAYHLGVGLDERTTIECAEPPGSGEVSVIWRSHDLLGPEIGRLRGALELVGARAGDEAFLSLDPDGLCLSLDGAQLKPEAPRSPEPEQEPLELPRLDDALLDKLRTRQML